MIIGRLFLRPCILLLTLLDLLCLNGRGFGQSNLARSALTSTLRPVSTWLSPSLPLDLQQNNSQNQAVVRLQNSFRSAHRKHSASSTEVSTYIASQRAYSRRVSGTALTLSQLTSFSFRTATPTPFFTTSSAIQKPGSYLRWEPWQQPSTSTICRRSSVNSKLTPLTSGIKLNPKNQIPTATFIPCLPCLPLPKPPPTHKPLTPQSSPAWPTMSPEFPRRT